MQKLFAVVVLGDSLLAEIIVGDEPTETVSYCNRRKVGRLRSLDRRGSERHVLGPGPSCFTARVSFQIVCELSLGNVHSRFLVFTKPEFVHLSF